MGDHLLLALERHWRNELAVGIVLRRIDPELGQPQQVEGRTHVDLPLNHRSHPASCAIRFQIRLLPTLDEPRGKNVGSSIEAPKPNYLLTAQNSL